MKLRRYIQIVCIISLSIISCNKMGGDIGGHLGAEADGVVEFTVTIEEALETKAVSGDEAYVNQLVYEVWKTTASETETITEENSRLWSRKAVPMTSGEAYISVNVVKNQNYRVLFWAQDSTSYAYDAADLFNVRLNAGQLYANQLNYSAFAGTDYLSAGERYMGRSVELNRVVSQLNIATKDDSFRLGGADESEVITINDVSVNVKGLSDTFNVAEMKAGDVTSQPVVFRNSAFMGVDYGIYDNIDYTYVSMNYLGFIPEEGTNIVVEYTMDTSIGQISNSVQNVPVKPNYRTNILGNLISATAGYRVTLNNE